MAGGGVPAARGQAASVIALPRVGAGLRLEPIQVYVGGLAVAAFMAVALGWAVLDRDLGSLAVVAIVTVLSVAVRVAPVTVSRDGHGEDIDLEECVVVASLLLLPAGGVLAAALASEVIILVVRPRSPIKVVHGIAVMVICTVAAVLLRDGLGDPTATHAAGFGVVALAALVRWVSQSGFVWLAIALATDRPLRGVARSSMRLSSLGPVAVIGAGLTAMAVAAVEPWLVVPALAPIALVHRVQRLHRDRQRLRGLLGVAVDSASAVAAGGVVPAVEEAVREMLAAETVRVTDAPPRPGEIGARLGTSGPARWLVAGERPRLVPYDEGDRELLRAAAAIATTSLESEVLLEQVMLQARRDTLTGLPNRLVVDERLAAAFASESSRPGVLEIDVDRFKRINDGLGHVAGDRLLTQIGERVVAAVGDRGTVCRLGGDELAVVVDDPEDDAELEALAEAIVTLMRRPFRVDGDSEIFATCSVGGARAAEGASAADDVLRAADRALYVAKRRGRDGFHIHEPAVPEKADLRLEHDLRVAVERSDLTVAYQPIVAVDGTLHAVEALARWQHPEHGAVPPERFVALAEEAGLIAAIDNWILRRALRQVAAWERESRRPPRICVNVSARTLSTSDFEAQVLAALDEAGLPPSALEIEVTEQVAVDEPEMVIDRLRRLRSAGVGIAIDDFGAGHSSLSRLDSFPADRLKIDRCFVARVTDENPDSPVIAAAVAVAHRLGMTVTAEGVETPVQLHYLRSVGCDSVQGWLPGEATAPEDATFLDPSARRVGPADVLARADARMHRAKRRAAARRQRTSAA